MAAREGIDGLPANSLIACTHYLADFLIGGFQRLKDEQMSQSHLNFDEAPHKMLEQYGNKRIMSDAYTGYGKSVTDVNKK